MANEYFTDLSYRRSLDLVTDGRVIIAGLRRQRRHYQRKARRTDVSSAEGARKHGHYLVMAERCLGMIACFEAAEGAQKSYVDPAVPASKDSDYDRIAAPVAAEKGEHPNAS